MQLSHWVTYGYKQDKISQELSLETKIFKTSYYTVLRAFSFKKINDASVNVTLTRVPLQVVTEIFRALKLDKTR
jgi:hypothetical protein